ncbi:hypothetical protein Pd630_LPD07686 [Rhodococcus opacus PD630]|nr:hypothetical protein Pd630_LPD07686 [Rhodococcus opacus PD630]
MAAPHHDQNLSDQDIWSLPVMSTSGRPALAGRPGQISASNL